MQPKPWFTRKFNLVQEPDIFPCILERLKGTPLRLEAKIAGFPANVLTMRRGEAWSIQEHAGHLYDLEPLWYGRIDDILAGMKIMREADLTNRKTHEANHNQVEIAQILVDFRKEREKFVKRLSGITIEDAQKSALHPRLMQPMKLIDLAFFVAEHDDHHLAMIEAM